ncbi:glycerate kinase [Saliphagus sp. LR7]|uniref:glycerate kinase type-2 family protein n=1 Tax=Saliphagus sp. LR7 TaxID=2282654 RepID=UPI000DF869F4|nr:DUF4147 domain-containing protein [Saliphagus sp. LR7]
MTAPDGVSHVEIENRERLERTPAYEVALDCLAAGIDAAHPRRVVGDALSLSGTELRVTDVGDETTAYDLSGFERVVVAGGGNAAGHLAGALSDLLGDRIAGGAVVTDDPTAAGPIEVLPGDHPYPSERGVESTRRVLEVAERAGPEDLVIAPITGGGSALLVAPAGALTVADLQELTEKLLESGAAIDEINAVRKRCSAVKGGGLAAAAAPARVLGVVMSDVVGDDPGTIASGPVSPDEIPDDEAWGVLDRYGIEAPAVREHLIGKRGDPGGAGADIERTDVCLIASSRTALDAARSAAGKRGYEPLVLSSRVRGEASEAGRFHAAIAEESRESGDPVPAPAVFLSAGETTVTVAGEPGIGGPNGEFALAAAIDLAGREGVVVGSVDTDGIDGASDAAGAIVDGETVTDRERAREALERNDVQTLLAEAGAVIRTGPTGTNVNDLRVVVVEPN